MAQSPKGRWLKNGPPKNQRHLGVPVPSTLNPLVTKQKPNAAIGGGVPPKKPRLHGALHCGVRLVARLLHLSGWSGTVIARQDRPAC